MIQGWLIHSPAWIPLGPPIETSFTTALTGLPRQKLKFQMTASEEINGLIVAIEEPNSTTFHKMVDSFRLRPGDTLAVTIERDFSP